MRAYLKCISKNKINEINQCERSGKYECTHSNNNNNSNNNSSCQQHMRPSRALYSLSAKSVFVRASTRAHVTSMRENHIAALLHKYVAYIHVYTHARRYMRIDMHTNAGWVAESHFMRSFQYQSERRGWRNFWVTIFRLSDITYSLTTFFKSISEIHFQY